MKNKVLFFFNEIKLRKAFSIVHFPFVICH